MNEKEELLLRKIREYSTIIIFRHDAPDFDAYGSQYALKYYLETNFPDKRILVTGTANAAVGKDLYPLDDTLSDEIMDREPFLALIVDTSSARRVSDQRFKHAAYIIKIDHHPAEKEYADLALIDVRSCAAAALIYRIMKSETFKDYQITRDVARHLLIGIIGDTNRLSASNADRTAFQDVAELLEYGVDLIGDVYEPMFAKSLQDFEAEKFIMANYKLTKNGVAYYYLRQEDLRRLKLDSDEAKKYLGMFNNVSGIKQWVCFAYDERKKDYRVSLRSLHYPVDEVAAMHGGGGHRMASGARAKDEDEAEQIIRELDARLRR